MCLEIYQLDPVEFLLVPRLVWQVALKKIKVKLELLTAIDMLLMVEKELEVEHVSLLIDIQKLTINI